MTDAEVRSFSRRDELESLMARGYLLARGHGSSYGDSACAPRVLLTRRHDRMLAFDPAAGLLHCEAGTTLADIVDCFVPRGWFLCVTPGTKRVSVGGAIAADVHGKNHHQSGCFSRFVESLELLLPSGQVRTCSHSENTELFRATCGGMGLTGVILTATLRLRPIASAHIDQRTVRARNLSHLLELFDEHAAQPYSVAWIDCLARGDRLGRALLMVGDHAPEGGLRLPRKRTLSVPPVFPGMALNPLTVRLFNALYHARPQSDDLRARVGLEQFFYPLDALDDWNNLYGRKGFLQYQFVIPHEAGAKGMTRVLERISAAGLGSFLAVLKVMGPANDNHLSFPMPGLTLALDFKNEPKLFPLLDELDRIVLDHGGRFYLAKDARMAPETFAAGYPMLDEFRALRRDIGASAISSLQSRRLEL